MNEKVQGMIQDVKELKGGKDKTTEFTVVKVNDIEYSYFKPDNGEKYSFIIGDTIEFNAVKRGKYNNLYNPKPCALSADALIVQSNLNTVKDPIKTVCDNVRNIAKEFGWNIDNLTEQQQKIIVTVLMQTRGR